MAGGDEILVAEGQFHPNTQDAYLDGDEIKFRDNPEKQKA